jgi:hypothetical protein
MPDGDLVYPEIEAVTPEQAARLRAEGVNLPQVSDAAADPRTHSDFIDHRLLGVGFGIYLGGYHLYVTEVGLPLLLPNSLVDLSGRPALAISPAIYPSLNDAQAAVRNAAPLAAGAPKGTVRFAYFRSYGGLIMPTVFSDVTAPRTIGTARQAMADLGRTVSEELVGVALSILGARILGGVYTRVVRGLNRWGGAPVRSTLLEQAEAEAAAASRKNPAGGTATETVKGPSAITPPSGAVSAETEGAAVQGRKIGDAVRGVQAGKRATLAQQVTTAQLSQANAVTATEEASRVAFGRIGPTVRLPNGDLVVTSVVNGPNQPVFIIKTNGSVLRARATITVTQPLSIENPVTISNVMTEQ